MMSGNMLPQFAFDDGVNRLSSHIVLTRKFWGGCLTRRKAHANRSHAFLVKLRIVQGLAPSEYFGVSLGPMTIASWTAFRLGSGTALIPTSRSSFSMPIRRVLFVSAKPKVRGIAARRIVALMQHPQAVGDRSMLQGVGDAVTQQVLIPNGQASVSVSTTIANPRPATIRRRGAINPRPVSLFDLLGGKIKDCSLGILAHFIPPFPTKHYGNYTALTQEKESP